MRQERFGGDMRKKLILFAISVLILILVFVSCDRFDNDFPVRMTESEFLEIFEETATNYLRENDISKVMSFFANDYLNLGITKSDLFDFFLDKEWSPVADIVVSNISSSNRIKAFNLSVTDNEADVDSTWVDFLENRNGHFLWVGNRQMPREPIEQVVLAQSFTGLWCPTCPDASGRLHTIESIYPDNFIFIDYHINDALAIYSNFAEERSYYNNINNLPTVVFQGQAIVRNLNIFQTTVEAILAVETEITFEDLEFSVENRDITGSIKIVFNPDNPPVSIENLYLYALIYQHEVPGFVYTTDPSKTASRVVRGRSRVPIEYLQSNQTLEFSVTSLFDITDDSYLVVWIQQMAGASLASGDRILNVVRKPLF
jgi:thiol-disulfide isomerase/thioredoxin